MAQVPSIGLEGYAGVPDVNMEYLGTPITPQPGETPMPYSPEGWAASKLLPGAEEAIVPVKGKEKAKEKAKGDAPGFTPDQVAALAKLTGVPDPVRPAQGHAGFAPRSTVGTMQQVTAPGGKEATAPRQSLGQIIYGGRGR